MMEKPMKKVYLQFGDLKWELSVLFLSSSLLFKSVCGSLFVGKLKKDDFEK